MGLWDAICSKWQSLVNNVAYSNAQNEAWYKTLHAEELATHNRSHHDEKTRKEKELREEYERVIANEENKMKADLKALAEGSNIRTRKELDEYVKFKKQREADFEVWRKKMETKYLSSVFDDKAVFLGMNGLEEQQEKMAKGEKEMKELSFEWKRMNQNSIDYNNNLFDQRLRMRSACDQQIMGRMDQHHRKMLELVEAGEARKLQAEVVLKGMAEKHRENELGFLDRQWEIEYWNVISRKELMKAVTLEEKHEEFRFECQNLVIDFNRFKASYYKEQPAFLQILEALKEKKAFDMRQGGNLLSGLPRFTDALGSLDIIDKGVILVKNQVDDLIKKLNYNFSQLTEVILAYKPGRHEKDNSHKTAVDYYNIIDSLVKELSEVMLGFNLKPSDAYEIEFEKQWNALIPSFYSIEGTRQQINGIKITEPRERFRGRVFDGTARMSRGIQEIEEEENSEVGLGLGLSTLSRRSVPVPTLPAFGRSVTVPSIGVTSPSIGVTLPNIGATVPGIGGTLPSIGATVPGIGGTLPSIGVTVPGIGGTLPSLRGTLPSIGATLPSIGTTLPSIGATLPSIGVTFPSIGATLPSIGVTSPNIGETLPSIRTTLPSVGATLPSIGATLPSIGVTFPSIGASLPSIGGTLPRLGGTLPSIEATLTGNPSDYVNNNVGRPPGNIQEPVTTKDWLESIVAENSESQKLPRETPILNGKNEFSSPIADGFNYAGSQQLADYEFRETINQEPEEYVIVEDERIYEDERIEEDLSVTKNAEHSGQQIQRTIPVKDTDQLSVQDSTFSDRFLNAENSRARHYENRKPKSINSSNNIEEEFQVPQEQRLKGIGSSDVPHQKEYDCEVFSSCQSVVSSVFQVSQVGTRVTTMGSKESPVERERGKSLYSENEGLFAMNQASQDFTENSGLQKKQKLRVKKPSQGEEGSYPGGRSGTRRPEVDSVTMTRSSNPIETGDSTSRPDKKPLPQEAVRNWKKRFDDVEKEIIVLSSNALKKTVDIIGNEGHEESKESSMLPMKQQSRVQVPTQNVRNFPDDRTGLSSKTVLNPETTPTPENSNPMETGYSKSRQTETPLLKKVTKILKKEFEDVEDQVVAHSSHSPEKSEVVIRREGPEVSAFEKSSVSKKKQSREQASTQIGRSSPDERPANLVFSKEARNTRVPEISQIVAGNDQEARIVNSDRPGHRGVGRAAIRHIEEWIEGIPATGKASRKAIEPAKSSKIVLKSYKKLGAQNEMRSSETVADNHPTQSSVALKKYVKLHEDPSEGLISAGKTLATAISNPVNLRDQLNHEIRSRSLKKHVANGISHVAPVNGKSLKNLEEKLKTKLLSPLKPVVSNLNKDIDEVKMIPKRISQNHMPRVMNPSTYINPVISKAENKLEGVERKILQTTEYASFLPAHPQIPRGLNPTTYIKNHYKSPALPHPYHLTFWLKKEKAESQK